MHTILVVDDELSIRESFNLILKDKYKVILAASGEAALSYAVDKKIDLIFLDIRMPGLDGLETLKRLKEINQKLNVIMVTAVNEVSRAALSIKLGAIDYIVKPFDVEKILSLTEKILRRKDLASMLASPTPKDENLLSSAVLELAKKAAKSLEPILLIGEEGTEKELLAYFIHSQSKAEAYAFGIYNIPKNISAENLRNKLFGKKSGETTVTLKKESGLFEQYEEGTLFINHIENIPTEMLEETLKTGLRLIFGGINEPPENTCFKQIIRISPLRERIADLPQLLETLLQKFNALYNKSVKGISVEAKNILTNYNYPGNMEELSALIERLVIKNVGEIIEERDLPFDLLINSNPLPLPELNAIFEASYNARGRSRTGTAYTAEGF